MGQRNILVTGGAGFLGSHLCEALLAAGERVICLDNMITGRIANITDLLSNQNFQFVKHDIIEMPQIDGELKEIYNLACSASPTKYQMDPIHTFKTCAIGAMNMLELARQKKARILQASTSEIYGDPEVCPQPESYAGRVNTFGIRSCYDEGKRAAETLFHDYNASYGIPIRIARIFNTYGPRMLPDDGRVISNFIVQSLLGENLTIYGSGEQTRSFCYVDELISGLMRLMALPSNRVPPMNLGNPTQFTVLELAKIVAAKTGAGSEISFHALPKDDPRQRQPDITFAKQMLGWEPSVDLSVGLDKTIDYFAGELSAPRRGIQGAA